MCGRFAVSITKSDIEKLLPNIENPEIEQSFNVAPTQKIKVIKDNDSHSFSDLRWGLIPSWAKDRSMASKMINSRSESAHQKPSFRSSFKRKRCAIPASGYYEWKKIDNHKSPFYIKPEENFFLFAGLWESWTDKTNGEIIETATIITKEANSDLDKVHHRMPLMLNFDNYEKWLSKEIGKDQIDYSEFPEPKIQYWEVSKNVNSPRNNSPELLDEING